MTKKILFISIIASMFIATSCNKKANLKFENKFENTEWNSFKNSDFKVAIKDTSNTYTIAAIVKLTDEFEPLKLSFGLSSISEEGESIYSNYDVNIKKLDKNFIEQKKGNYYEYKILINKSKVFNSLGNYTFSFESLMSQLNTKGVYSITLEIVQK